MGATETGGIDSPQSNVLEPAEGAEGLVVWVTGMPSSGKSTYGRRLVNQLREEGVSTCFLDGDELRAALVPAPGYDESGRRGFYSTLVNLSTMLASQGLVVVVAATAHRRSFRRLARKKAPAFLEVFVDVAPAECSRRDAKGLYASARTDPSSTLPGAGVAYERPRNPDFVAVGGRDPEAIRRVVARIRSR